MDIGTQFTLDFEFVASCIGHAFAIFMLLVFLPRLYTMCRLVGLPVVVVKKDKNKWKVKK